MAALLRPGGAPRTGASGSSGAQPPHRAVAGGRAGEPRALRWPACGSKVDDTEADLSGGADGRAQLAPTSASPTAPAARHRAGRRPPAPAALRAGPGAPDRTRCWTSCIHRLPQPLRGPRFSHGDTGRAGRASGTLGNGPAARTRSAVDLSRRARCSGRSGGSGPWPSCGSRGRRWPSGPPAWSIVLPPRPGRHAGAAGRGARGGRGRHGPRGVRAHRLGRCRCGGRCRSARTRCSVKVWRSRRARTCPPRRTTARSGCTTGGPTVDDWIERQTAPV